MAFLPDGRILIAEKNGVVRIVKNGALLPTPFIDIHNRVNDYWDHGLLGIAVDPNFATNGYVYLLYTYENNPNDYSGLEDRPPGALYRRRRHGVPVHRAGDPRHAGRRRSCDSFPVGADCIPSDYSVPLDRQPQVRRRRHAVRRRPATARTSTSSTIDALRAQSLDSLGRQGAAHHPDRRQGVAVQPLLERRPERQPLQGVGLRPPQRLPVQPEARTPACPSSATWAGTPGRRSTSRRPARTSAGPATRASISRAGTRALSELPDAVRTGARSATVRAPLVAYPHSGCQRCRHGRRLLHGTAYPAQYQGAYFYGDYVPVVHQIPQGRRQQQPELRADRLRDRGRRPREHRAGPGRTSLLRLDRLRPAAAHRLRRSAASAPPPPPLKTAPT